MEKLAVTINAAQLIIDATQNKNFNDLELLLTNHEQEYFFKKEVINTDEMAKHYRFTLDLKWVLQALTDLHLEDNDLTKLVIMHRYTRINEDNGETIEYDRPVKLPIRREWQLNGIERINSQDNAHYLQPYITKKNTVAFLFDREINLRHYMNYKVIRKIKVQEDRLLLEGFFDTLFFPLKDCHLLIVERSGEKTYSQQFEYHSVKTKYSRIYRYAFKLELTMADLSGYIKQLDQSNELSLDLFFSGTLKGTNTPLQFRVGNPRFITNYTMKGEMALDDPGNQQWLSLVPYFTIKGLNLSFIFNAYQQDAYEYFRKHQHNWHAVAKQAADRDIWIVGERSYKAQDNGFRFFKYLREVHPEIEAYYVIRKDSVERENVAPLGNIIDFGSAEHFEKVIQAKYICGTHHPDFLYPIRSKAYEKQIHAKRIFLQHGVFGTKNIAPFYGKSAVNGFYTDLFITSSPKEKQIAIADLGYQSSEVAVTGLSRFDSLFEQDLPLKRQLLIIPTWRDWITNDEIFEKSEYLARYRELLFDQRLKEFSERYNMDVVFCLHPNMQAYVDYFKDAPVKIVHQGEIDVQVLIKESAMMLTDYSSVAFDFSFLHRPVLYYQFDRTRFIGKYTSHIDLDNELPGPIVDSVDGIFEQLFRYGDHGFTMRERDVQKADKFIAYRDTHSCDRIFKAITSLPDKTMSEKVHNNEFYLKLQTKFRRTRKLYFPTMKTLYWFWSHFSHVKKNRIMFESSVGKRYEDSPRVIYEEMVKAHPEFEYIWVSRNNQPLQANPRTKIVRRLSFDYYRYLATSRYWINNQNFPTYLTKRKGTAYLQTWHGTPLKKMQHDLQVIEGRKPGYLKRVTHAKNQWSALVSPSPYATRAFRSAFHYDGPVIEKGYPRNDLFYSNDAEQVRQRVRKRLQINPNKKVILYAPTFRDYEKSHGRFVLDNQLDFDEFERQLGNDYVLLIREHVVVASKLKIPQTMRHNIINVSNYPSVQELMVASDALITDYSSIMFDYLNTNKPIYFFCYDLEKYLELRGVYFDFTKEIPGPIVKDATTLFNEISKGEQYWQTYGDKYQSFKDKFVPYDGKNTAVVVYQTFLRMFEK
ncbi:CDP-glycerol glycerophosphotransferase family protein [Lactiplantibacillus argentoratensis]|uniref:CDP-glycerol glycerophosphotransferase family protein n=1 Tax=Lactiplantibacillus argentoratensis TaxID=271881 RepID=UPI001C105372|nr:CDP-glycerol glycerophosphotransferase family protein [Lactiplantibacillus argentoratensis]MBU5276772.1 CDP-glycerol glycerophosphotransferase family protein [Lactiplantibacillus argentoratensis]